VFSNGVIAALGSQESCSCVLQDTAQVHPLFDVMFDVPSEPAVGSASFSASPVDAGMSMFVLCRPKMHSLLTKSCMVYPVC
jgi:hypothetical protein